VDGSLFQSLLAPIFFCYASQVEKFQAHLGCFGLITMWMKINEPLAIKSPRAGVKKTVVAFVCRNSYAVYLRNPLETKRLPPAQVSASDRHSPKTNKRTKNQLQNTKLLPFAELGNVFFASWR
jgi:hypothetical protein